MAGVEFRTLVGMLELNFLDLGYLIFIQFRTLVGMLELEIHDPIEV